VGEPLKQHTLGLGFGFEFGVSRVVDPRNNKSWTPRPDPKTHPIRWRLTAGSANKTPMIVVYPNGVGSSSILKEKKRSPNSRAFSAAAKLMADWFSVSVGNFGLGMGGGDYYNTPHKPIIMFITQFAFTSPKAAFILFVVSTVLFCYFGLAFGKWNFAEFWLIAMASGACRKWPKCSAQSDVQNNVQWANAPSNYVIFVYPCYFPCESQRRHH